MKSHVRSDWRKVVLVCRKCSKKLDGGFGAEGKLTLAKALKRSTGGGKHRKADLGVIEVACLDICPKGAVVAIAADRPREWQILPRGTPMDDVAIRLGLVDQPVAA